MMGSLTPGYWPANYWPANYWVDDYWADYGAVEPSILDRISIANKRPSYRLAQENKRPTYRLTVEAK